MENALDCFDHLTKMATAPKYGNTKYVSLKAVVDVDQF